jgi:hypothetical protein
MTAELQLITLLVGLYLYDSTLFLHPNQGVIVRAFDRRWHARFGSFDMQLWHKEPLLLNPLLPFHPAFTAFWRFDETGEATRIDWDAMARIYSGFTVAAIALAVVLFVAFPCVLLLKPTNTNVLATIVLAYALIFALVGVALAKRSRLEISRRKMAGILFECVICPPLAVNIVRKLSLARTLRADFVQVCSELATAPDAWQIAQANLIRRLDRKQAGAEPGSKAAEAMAARQTQILSVRR